MLPYVPGLSGAARGGGPGRPAGPGREAPTPSHAITFFCPKRKRLPRRPPRPDVLVLFCVRGPEGAEVRDAPARRQAGTQAEQGGGGRGLGGSDPGANAPRVRGRDGAGACVPRPPPGAVFFWSAFLERAPRWCRWPQGPGAVVRAGRAQAGAGGAVDGATLSGSSRCCGGPGQGAGACPAQAQGGPGSVL